MSCSTTSHPCSSAYAKATSAFAEPAKVNPALPAPQLPPLYSIPTMRSKPVRGGSASVSPDFAAMRCRRGADLPSLRQLQQQRNVMDQREQGSLHEAVLEAYGYRQVAAGVFALSRAALDIFHTLAGFIPDIHVGPRGCAAASLPSRAMLDTLVHEFAADIECWISPAAKDSADSAGLLIVFGEDHFDPQIRSLSARLMREFSPRRGDRFFMEGAERWICDEREQRYHVPSGSCRLLEKDSEVEEQFRLIEQRLDKSLMDCLDYLRHHVPGATMPPDVDDDEAIQAYLKRWLLRLPSKARSGFDTLGQKYGDASRQYSQLLEDTSQQRDDIMADVLKRDIGPGWNFAIVGANHLHGLRDRLSTLPCLFMVPKAIVDKEPDLSLQERARDEL